MRAGRDPLRRRFWIVFGIVAVIGISVVAVIGSLYAGSASNVRSEGHPRAVVGERKFELGVVESPDAFTHKFVIRNEGDAPLTLTRGASNCKCTITELPEAPVPPGGQVEVGVAFKLVPRTGFFSRGAKILTNDPENPELLLGLEGTVHRRLAAEPDAITMSVPFSGDRTASTTVFSQIWKQFQLAVVKRSNRGMRCRIVPASKEELDKAKALCGYRVEVELSPDMPDGHFSDYVELTASPNDSADSPQSLSLQVQGNIYGRLTFHGAKIDDQRVLHLGTVRAGEGACENLVMKVHDAERSLSILGVQSDPQFMSVRVVPLRQTMVNAGLYSVEVRIPPDAPSSVYLGERSATVRLTTNHPRLPVIEIKVEFCVVGGDSQENRVSRHQAAPYSTVSDAKTQSRTHRLLARK